MVKLTRQYPKPSHTILHISDTQLLGKNGNWHDYPVNADSKLQETVDSILHSQIKPDAIIFTGDLADDGETEAYQKLLTITEPLTNITPNLIWVMGNHDKREPFNHTLMGTPNNQNTVDHVYHVNGLRIIVLDTTVPNHHHGDITDEQHVWLKNELKTSAPAGTILALHHPPMPTVMPLAITVELQNQHKLGETIKNSDIRTIVAGHFHYSTFTTFKNIPVSVASSTCYTQDLATLEGATRGRDTAQSYNLIQVYEENIMHSVVPVGSSQEVGEYVPPEQATQHLKDHNITL